VAKRARYPRRSEVNPAIERWLLTGEIEGLPFECYPPSVAVGRLWAQHGAALLEAFIENNPSRRPWAWWAVDSPSPRQRVGGRGTPAHECLAFAEELAFGIPLHWVRPWMVRYYGSTFRGVPIDPNDPVRYEAEAVFLDRHRLLTVGERSRLAPKDFEPEIILPAEEDEDR
jgi:hypothetical protein